MEDGDEIDAMLHQTGGGWAWNPFAAADWIWQTAKFLTWFLLSKAAVILEKMDMKVNASY